MAVRTTLKQMVGRIAESLREYAKENEWGPEDYQIYYNINSKWERIHMLFIAREFENRSDFENYVMVREYLAKKLTDQPEILTYMGLVVRSPKQVQAGGIYAIVPEYREYKPVSRQ